jgi:dimethylargininase
MLTAITRAVSSSLGDCELAFLSRERIDLAKAVEQHRSYEARLEGLGARVIRLPAEDDLPDAVFVEDTAVVLDEVAVISRPGAASRRPETAGIAALLSRHRPLEFIQPPATLDGGDVLRIGRTLLVGEGARTDLAGLEQLRQKLAPYDYRVQSASVRGCLHLKTGCTFIGENCILINREWVDDTALAGFDLIDLPKEEPFAANTLVIGGVVLLPASFPQTRALLESRGFAVESLDIHELQKAEAGLSCLSLLFQ